jgi:hypothetical protein
MSLTQQSMGTYVTKTTVRGYIYHFTRSQYLDFEQAVLDLDFEQAVLDLDFEQAVLDLDF